MFSAQLVFTSGFLCCQILNSQQNPANLTPCFVNVSLLIWCFIKCTSGICPSLICFDGDKNKLSKYLTGFKWYSMCAHCSIAKGCMFKTHSMLSKRQKGCISLSSVEFSDRLNVFVILPDNGALIGDFPRKQRAPFVPSVAQWIPFLSSFFSCICTDSGVLGLLWLASLVLPVHVPPQERHRPSSASATMALQRAAGDLRGHAVCSWKGSLSAGPLDFFYCGAESPKSAWGLSLSSVSGGGRERLQISTVFCLSLSSFSAHCCQWDFLSLSLKVQAGPPKHHWLHFWRSFAPSDDNLDSSGFQRFLNRVYTNIYIHSRTKGDMKNIHCGTARLYFMFTC